MKKIINCLIIIGIIILIYKSLNNTVEHMTDYNGNKQLLTYNEHKSQQKLKKKTQRFKKNMIKQIIYTKVLKKTKEALDELNIPFFLSSGTCLGYFRENQFLEYDYDIDIGIFKEDYTPQIINKMEEKGLILYRTLGNYDTGLELSFRLNGTKLGKKAKVDIFLHYHNNDKIYWSSYKAPDFTEKIIYQVSKFDLKPINFMGIEVNVPYPTLSYVRQHYGHKWYTPIKTKGQGGKYDYRSSPTSIVKSLD